MNARIAMLTAALIAMAPTAYAGESADPIKELAAYTGLSERRVQMVLGCRTCFAEYVYTYGRSLDRFKRALGNERYQQLIAGQPVQLDQPDGERVLVAIQARPDAP